MGIIKEYSKKLTKDLKKSYTKSTLYNMRNFYCFIEKTNFQTVYGNLTWSHYLELLKFTDNNMRNYYLKIVAEQNLSVRQLREKIKSNEYERLDKETKLKLINKETLEVNDFVKNPIIIKNSKNYEIINEKILKQLILEDLENFMKELGNGFSFIGSEYKIKVGIVIII